MTSSLLAKQVTDGDKIRGGAHRSLEEANAMEGTARRTPRYFGDGKGRVLSEEGRAAENVYIQVNSLTFLSFDLDSIGVRLRPVSCVENGEGADGDAQAEGREGEAGSREGRVRESKQILRVPFFFVCD